MLLRISIIAGKKAETAIPLWGLLEESVSWMNAMAERSAARRLSERIEKIIEANAVGNSDDLLDVARQLAHLTDAFGPPDPAFERRLAARIEARLAEQQPRKAAWRPRWAWGAVLGMVLLLVAVSLFTAPGQAAWAELAAILRLDRTQVRVEPEIADLEPAYTATAGLTLSNLDEAKAAVSPRVFQTPGSLPEGYGLHRISTSHFEELPAWVQPLFVDITYRRETREIIWELSYRQYFIASSGPGTIEALAYTPEEFETVQQASVAGRPAALLSRPSTWPVPGAESVLHLVWEGEDALFTLTSAELSSDELIRIAESVAPYR